MKVLHIEDAVIKHYEICKVMKKCGVLEIDWVKTLDDALQMVREHKLEYNLIVTDMYYPLTPGGDEAESGLIFIQKLEEMKIETPIIVCSSVRYQIPGICGSVHYSDKTDWEQQLCSLIRQCK